MQYGLCQPISIIVTIGDLFVDKHGHVRNTGFIHDAHMVSGGWWMLYGEVVVVVMVVMVVDAPIDWRTIVVFHRCHLCSSQTKQIGNICLRISLYKTFCQLNVQTD